MVSRVDLHAHTCASDGTDSPEELLNKAAALGLDTLAITDHDTLEGVRAVGGRAPEGLRLIPGVELSCRGRAGKCHILGLGVDIENRELSGAVDAVSILRREKLEKRLGFLFRRGMRLPWSDVEALRAMPSAGKPHIAAALIKNGLVPDKKAAFGLLAQCETWEDRIDAQCAVSAILAAGGVPVWAHPRGGVDGKVGETEFRALLPELVSYGLGGLECFYSMYPERLCRELAATAEKWGLFVSAGSDYHGANKDVLLGNVTQGPPPEPEEITVLTALIK